MPSVEIKIIGANKLPQGDIIGKSDPYLYISTSKGEIRTEVVKNTLDPVWDEMVVMDIGDPLKDAVCFQVYDWDMLGKHDFLCAGSIMVNDLVPGVPKDMTVKLFKIDKKEWKKQKKKGGTRPPLKDRGTLHIIVRALDFGPYVQPPDVQGFPIYFHCLPGFEAPPPIISPFPYKDPLPPVAKLPDLDNYEGEVPKEWKRMKCGFLKPVKIVRGTTAKKVAGKVKGFGKAAGKFIGELK